MAAAKGNRYASNRKRWQHAIEQALARSGGSIEKGLAPIADKLIAAALDGDADAREEIANRLDGKPIQTIDQHITEHVTAEDLTDGELASIARGSSAGTADSPLGEAEPPAVH